MLYDSYDEKDMIFFFLLYLLPFAITLALLVYHGGRALLFHIHHKNMDEFIIAALWLLLAIFYQMQHCAMRIRV